jgi:hypothetical protein
MQNRKEVERKQTKLAKIRGKEKEGGMKVKPCPFCGSEDIEVRERDMGVRCRGCDVWMPSIVSSDKASCHSALAGWNQRIDDIECSLRNV